MARNHSDTDVDTSVYRHDAVALLWAGVLLAPLAFICGLITLYALSSPECHARHSLILLGVHAASSATGLLGLVAAWSSHHTTRHGSSAAALGPGVRFLAELSIGSSALFVLAMLVQWAISLAYIACV